MPRRPGLDRFGPGELHTLYTGLAIPDPITFTVSPDYLDRPNLYPRQATLLKVIFLRDDLFTAYDHAVIDEWERTFAAGDTEEGICPGVRDRIRTLKASGARWFREVLLVMGRRGGKGHVSAIAMSYVIWCYMALGDPQGHYGVDRDKTLSVLIFAGKRDQAKANLWGDLVNVITGSACFAPYVSADLAEKVSLFAPNDYLRMARLAEKGLATERDQATIEILPKESTKMAGRGPASFILAFDEMAHVVAAGANRSAEDVYDSSTPSLDQFGADSFMIEPSSPYQMTGQFHVNYLASIAVEEDGTPSRPDMLMIQLPSWSIYEDHQRAHELELFPAGFTGDLGEYLTAPLPTLPPLKGAIQAYDDHMRKLEEANPETFAVERRSHFATVVDAYLRKDRVQAMFAPWTGRPDRYGSPYLTMQHRGILSLGYMGHADPSKSNCNFGLSLGHVEVDEDGASHVVFDRIKHWEPKNFPGHIVDYDEINDWIWDNVLEPFVPSDFTFDQYSSVQSIQRLTKRVRAARLPKAVNVYEKTATAARNWERAEIFKTALYLGRLHAPEYELAELELQFLQKPPNVDKVICQTIGPVVTKDVADTLMEVVMGLIGDEITALRAQLGEVRLTPGLQGGIKAFPGMDGERLDDADPRSALSGFGRRGRPMLDAQTAAAFSRARRRR